MGTLYYGDNLDILRRYLKDESVDLVYLDPSFNSVQNYNAFFHEKDGTDAASQIRAFEDTWSWNQESQKVYEELILQPGKVSEVMQAFHTFLGTNDMMAYLAMMAPRLVELRRALIPTGWRNGPRAGLDSYEMSQLQLGKHGSSTKDLRSANANGAKASLNPACRLST